MHAVHNVQTDRQIHTHTFHFVCVGCVCRPLVCVEVGSGTGILLAAVAKILGSTAFYL